MKNEVKKKQRESRILQALSYYLLSYRDTKVVKYINLIEVVVSPDLSVAKVFYALLNSEDQRAEAKAFWEDQKGVLRTKLAKSLNLRITPELRFILDTRDERASRLDELINNS